MDARQTKKKKTTKAPKEISTTQDIEVVPVATADALDSDSTSTGSTIVVTSVGPASAPQADSDDDLTTDVTVKAVKAIQSMMDEPLDDSGAFNTLRSLLDEGDTPTWMDGSLPSDKVVNNISSCARMVMTNGPMPHSTFATHLAQVNEKKLLKSGIDVEPVKDIIRDIEAEDNDPSVSVDHERLHDIKSGMIGARILPRLKTAEQIRAYVAVFSFSEADVDAILAESKYNGSDTPVDFLSLRLTLGVICRTILENEFDGIKTPKAIKSMVNRVNAALGGVDCEGEIKSEAFTIGVNFARRTFFLSEHPEFKVDIRRGRRNADHDDLMDRFLHAKKDDEAMLQAYPKGA